MGVLEWIARRRGYVKAADVGRLMTMALSRSTGISPEKSYYQLVDAYRSWVYTCIDKIAKTVAALPLKLYVYRHQGNKILEPFQIKQSLKELPANGERKYWLKQAQVEREEITEHPFLQLINSPNGIMTRFMLWYETLIRMELGGMCGWYLAANRLGIPGQVWPLPLTRTAILKPVVSSRLEIERWHYEDSEVKHDFKPTEILLLKYPHPKSPFDAMSPLIAQTYPYDIDLFLMQQQRALFENQAIPGLTLTTDQQLTAVQVKEIKEMLDEQYAGALKAGKSMMLHSGLKAEVMGMTARDAMIDEVARYAREKLITAYDLSEGKLGLVRDVNRANMEALDRTFILECLKPKCMLIEEAIEAFLLPRYDRGLTCDFDLPDVENREQNRLEMDTRLNRFVTTINEERGRMGMDDVPWGDVPWIPFTVMQPGTSPPAAQQEQPKQADIEGDEKVFAIWSPDKRRRTWEIWAATQKRWETLFATHIGAYFRQQGTEVVDRLMTLGPQIQKQYAGWSRKAVQEHMAKKDTARDINIDVNGERARLTILMRPLVGGMIEDRAGTFLNELGISITFNVNDPAVEKWLGTRLEQFSNEVTGTTFDEINAVLREGFREGKPLSVIADTLREKFTSYEKYRAAFISRTETISGLNKTGVLAARQAGLQDVLKKHWLSAHDEAVRPSHAEAERRYESGIGLDENFDVGGDSMDAPGNGSDPAENINCRCTLTYTRRK